MGRIKGFYDMIDIKFTYIHSYIHHIHHIWEGLRPSMILVSNSTRNVEKDKQNAVKGTQTHLQ
jgi:hypothetical protein